MKASFRAHREVLDEAFALLGEDIIIVDAKDTDTDGVCGHLPPGLGLLDFDHILPLVSKLGWDVPVIVEGHTEEVADLEKSIALVRDKMPK